MNSGYTKQVRDRILLAEDGTVFAASDFADIADAATIRQCLKRLVESGILRRILRGIFEKPKFSPLLNEYMAPDPDSVAQALARTCHWTIAPSGNMALNILGLSTQVPAVWSYVSDGPYRTYEWESTRIEFRHRTNKEITGLSYTSAVVVQALKALGKQNMTQEIIENLSLQFSDSEKAALFKETCECADWIYAIIRQICQTE